MESRTVFQGNRSLFLAEVYSWRITVPLGSAGPTGEGSTGATGLTGGPGVKGDEGE